MSTIESVIFTVLLAIAVIFFLKRIYTLFALVLLGRGENRFDRLFKRLKDMLLFGFVQKRVIEKPFGFNHFFLFWGFIVLLIINIEFVVAGMFPRFSFSFLGDGPYAVLRFIADIMSFVVLLAIIFAFIRRIFFKPPHIDNTWDAFFILSTVAALMIAYFGINITEILTYWGVRVDFPMPVSMMFSSLFSAGGNPETLHVVSRIFWWIHALVFLTFLLYIPYSKHLHVLTSLFNVFYRRSTFPSTLPRMEFREGLSFGVSKITQFTWKDLLDFLSCSECGRCQSVCPAHNTGKPLNPKQVIHQAKLNLFANGDAIRASRPADTIEMAQEDFEPVVSLIGKGEASVLPEAIWSCTTCGACVEKCPIFLEQFPKLLQMRRHLVMEKVDFPEEVIAFFEHIEERSNPWGIARADRGKWAQNLNVGIFGKDDTFEYLLYMGCESSYDSRMRHVSTSVVDILRNAGVSFGILGADEICCGDAMRRLGNEYVFERMAKRSVKDAKRLGVKKVITLCPHCYNTLKNDYKQYGADFSVFHHTEFIYDLIRKGKLDTKDALHNESIVFHDSCYLGRYNNIYEEPRKIIQNITGKKPNEMPKNRRDSFCCGAGGGRMWMEENIGTRINAERTREALREKPTIIATSCPYCMTMFEDGLKEENVQENIRVLDIAEIVREGLVKK
jgi:Fe-S oxidoreductase